VALAKRQIQTEQPFALSFQIFHLLIITHPESIMSKVRGPALYRLVPSKTLFMLCDVQEKFKPAIPLLSSLIENTTKLVRQREVTG